MRSRGQEGPLRKLITGLPIGEVLDLVASRPEDRVGCDDNRLRNVLLVRREDMIACWQAEPAKRLPRARAFALIDQPWFEMYARGAADERAAIEAVAAASVPELLVALVDPSDVRQWSATHRLLRAAAAEQRARGAYWLATLRGQQPDSSLVDLLLHSRGHWSPTAFAPEMASEQLEVRARTAMLLRHLWRQPLPPGVTEVVQRVASDALQPFEAGCHVLHRRAPAAAPGVETFTPEPDASPRRIKWLAMAREWHLDPEQVLRRVRSGALQKELAVAAVPKRGGLGLSVLVELLPERRTVLESIHLHLAAAIDNAPAGDPVADLAALQALATDVPWQLQLAVAKRAAGLGEPGRELAAAALGRAAAIRDQKHAPRYAAHLALEIGIAPPDVSALAQHLRRHALVGRDRAIADALAIRYADLTLGEAACFDKLQVLLESGADFDVATVRTVVQPDPDERLWKILNPDHRLLAPATAIAALQVAGEQPIWSWRIERTVVGLTLHADPRVRIAAYLTLRTRDPGVFAGPWLAYEAALDPDPALRAFAESLPR